MFPMGSQQVPQVFKWVPQHVPNSTLFFSHILCPKFCPKKWRQKEEILTHLNLGLSGLQSLINFFFFFFLNFVGGLYPTTK